MRVTLSNPSALILSLIDMRSSGDVLASDLRRSPRKPRAASPQEIESAIKAAALELKDVVQRLALAEEDATGAHSQFDMVEAFVTSSQTAEDVGRRRAVSILHSVARSLRQTADRLDAVSSRPVDG